MTHSGIISIIVYNMLCCFYEMCCLPCMREAQHICEGDKEIGQSFTHGRDKKKKLLFLIYIFALHYFHFPLLYLYTATLQLIWQYKCKNMMIIRVRFCIPPWCSSPHGENYSVQCSTQNKTNNTQNKQHRSEKSLWRKRYLRSDAYSVSDTWSPTRSSVCIIS